VRPDPGKWLYPCSLARRGGVRRGPGRAEMRPRRASSNVDQNRAARPGVVIAAGAAAAGKSAKLSVLRILGLRIKSLALFHNRE
jgi:hypothetical protein